MTRDSQNLNHSAGFRCAEILQERNAFRKDMIEFKDDVRSNKWAFLDAQIFALHLLLLGSGLLFR